MYKLNLQSVFTKNNISFSHALLTQDNIEKILNILKIITFNHTQIC